MERIDKIEQFALYRYVPEKKQVDKKFWLSRSCICFFIAVFCFVMAFVILAGVENINIFPFYWTLLLIPICPVLAIKRCESAINKASHEEKPYQIVMRVFAPVACVITAIFLDRNLQRDTNSIVIGVVSLLGGLLTVYAACSMFYRVYLIRKYAPYFKDERLRGEAAPPPSE